MTDNDRLPNLDKARSRLINSARLLADAGSDLDQAEAITTGALADLRLRTVSPGRWVIAVELLEQLAAVTAAFDLREEALGPWRSDVENGVVSPDWGDALTVLAESINGRIDHLLDYGRRHGTPLEVVPQQTFTLDLFEKADVALFDSIDRVLLARVR